MTRQEHLYWAKKRAMEYVERGDYLNGITSMLSDLTKHEELKNHRGIEIGIVFMMNGRLLAYDDAKHFIEGFN